MRTLLFVPVAAMLLAFSVNAKVKPVDFAKEIRPIFKKSCLRCHDAKKKKGDLRLDKKKYAMRGGESGVVIVPNKSADSKLFKLISLDPEHEDYMPSKGDPLTKEQIALIGRWIDEGAKWAD